MGTPESHIIAPNNKIYATINEGTPALRILNEFIKQPKRGLNDILFGITILRP